MVAPAARPPAAFKATISAWSSPGGRVAPSKPPGSMTQPTQGLGDVEARTDAASSRARRMVPSVEVVMCKNLTVRSSLVMRRLLGQQRQSVRQDVGNGVEALDGSRARPGEVDDDAPSPGPGHTAGQAAFWIDKPRGFGESRRRPVEDRDGALGREVSGRETGT